jgi:hypothetical protein
VTAFDPDLHEHGHKLEVIEARLARQEKAARRAMIGVMILVLPAFGALVTYLLDIL